jgi:peptide/nickel transport system substrate-binding protein
MLKIKNIYNSTVDYSKKIISILNVTEITILIILSVIFIISSFSILVKINNYFTTDIPSYGGYLNEGIVGSPRFINPLLELSDADKDLTYIIYSGLMRAKADGTLIPDLAESYSVSEDSLTYTFIIKDNAFFHDGKKVTTDDIEYTIKMSQDAILRSPKRSNWVGIKIEKKSATEISFTLEKPYSPFLENTTIGILPKHIWNNASADEFPFSSFNIEPVGSGPYQIKKIKRNSSGIPIYYELKSFNKYTLGKPFITNIKFNFYSNEDSLLDAYLSGQIDNTQSISPQNLDDLINSKKNIYFEKISLPRIFGVFFNQNQAKIFLNKEVRQALDMTVDKDRIISEVLIGHGKKLSGPLPNNILNITTHEETSVYNKEEALNNARELLIKNDWKFNEENKVWEKAKSKNEVEILSFSIATSNISDLKRVAEILKEDWSLLGVNIEIQIFESSDLNQDIIGQRKYDALLFGQIINRSLDLYAFWHSSQRNNGFNVAMYTNSKVDRLLEDTRRLDSRQEKIEKYNIIEAEIKNDIPAIFIYSPELIYILSNKVKGFKSGIINNRSERFEEIYNWYIETDKIWNFLTK